MIHATADHTISWASGGGGNDAITTGEGNSIVAGDSTLGNAQRNVTVAGEKGNITLTNAIDWDSLVPPSSDVDDAGTADAGVDLVVSHSANNQTGKIYGYG